ncbi:RNA-binding domain-containing protein [Mytilinidion resinicola]|uniref:RNA-binding domain-containing protein n=1 Tax=Mytilinidion resinicola TaxID=574789 RepID=A0A6A6YZ80_9PEZI|nr:RNA-binding domain-containing protein [Mytilinidion resinicola]KAF2813314.1 RNA-binding domain-containing protein [Mytilinidion resinicola]
MADKLNQSLDDILKTRRDTRPNRGGRRGGKAAAAAPPVGGVKKNTRAAAKQTGKHNAPTGPSGATESKINVSNLPNDVDEQQIKEYFIKTVGPVKKVIITYGPNGVSRGIAAITFAKATAAAEAAKSLNGVKVDNRPMKIEVMVNPKDLPPAAPVKSFSERVSQPKNAAKSQPKPATAGRDGKGTTRGRGKTARGRNAGRGKPKTADELDAEMADYFVGDAPNGDAMVTNGGAVQVPAGGDTGMDDDIL